jgi:chemotaxis protein methyltransferase CheR
MSKYELGIVDTRNILKAIQEHYEYDFKNYALTFFKRRLEYMLEKYNLKTAYNLIRVITNDDAFFQVFLKEICIENTEMFRDPSLWRFLMDGFLTSLIKKSASYKIWFPEVSSGEELYSLMILLTELNLREYVEIHASSISEMRLDEVKQGVFDASKMEVNEANFKRIFRNKELNEYCTIKDDQGYMAPDLMKNIHFFRQDALMEQYPKGIKLIFWRNQMLYYNQIMEERMLKTMNSCLVAGGHMIIGLNEKIDYWNSNKDFILVGENDGVYKKKFS